MDEEKKQNKNEYFVYMKKNSIDLYSCLLQIYNMVLLKEISEGIWGKMIYFDMLNE